MTKFHGVVDSVGGGAVVVVVGGAPLIDNN